MYGHGMHQQLCAFIPNNVNVIFRYFSYPDWVFLYLAMHMQKKSE